MINCFKNGTLCRFVDDEGRPAATAAVAANTAGHNNVLSVTENLPAGTHVGTLRLAGQHSRNLDVTIYPVKVRRLIDARPIYAPIMAAADRDNTTRIVISTLQPLDHETDPVVKFRVVASNPASGETASMACQMTVGNVNDNAPVFKQKIYSLSTSLGI